MKEQNFANHARYFPIFHFIAFPILAGHAAVKIVDVFQAPGAGSLWDAAVAIAILLGVFGARVMALRVQDRTIRLEMRLRLAQVLPDDLQPVIPTLLTGQLIGLRFASDEELPDLVRRVSSGELSEKKAIKQAVTDWQADWLRV